MPVALPCAQRASQSKGAIETFAADFDVRRAAQGRREVAVDRAIDGELESLPLDVDRHRTYLKSCLLVRPVVGEWGLEVKDQTLFEIHGALA